VSAANKPVTKLLNACVLIAGVAISLCSLHVQAMVPLEEDEMSGVTGEGLAFVFDDFSLRMAPTSYVELIGSDPTAQAAAKGWKRGDARYYGLSMTSGEGDGASWFNDTCSGDGLKCPLGKGSNDNYGVTGFASVYDPFVLRVYQYEGYTGEKDSNGLAKWSNAGSDTDPTVFEFIGPSSSDAWRWAFWGELDIDRGGPNEALLQSQTLIYGKPLTVGNVWDGGNNYSDGDAKPAILRLMETTDGYGIKTLGITYQSALSGDFRFSVAQQSDSPNDRQKVPLFEEGEGMHFKNVDAYIPLGNLNYQAVTFSGVSEYNTDATKSSEPMQNGNFTIDLTRIPDDPNVYNHFYCGARGDQGEGCALDSRGVIANPNRDTEAYIRWGNWADPNGTPGIGSNDLPTATSTANGIYFQSSAETGGQVTNLGISRIEGMRIHHMRITTLGAGVD